MGKKALRSVGVVGRTLVEKLGNANKVGLRKTTRSHGGRTETNTTGGECAGITVHGVLVHGDAERVKKQQNDHA
jgi:hypothetical protein